MGFNLNSHFASNEKKKKTHGNALLWNWDTSNERWPFKKKTTNGCLNKKQFVENEKTDDRWHGGFENCVLFCYSCHLIHFDWEDIFN